MPVCIGIWVPSTSTKATLSALLPVLVDDDDALLRTHLISPCGWKRCNHSFLPSFSIGRWRLKAFTYKHAIEMSCTSIAYSYTAPDCGL